MTNEECQAAKTRLNELDSASNELGVIIRDGNEQARDINAGVRAAMKKQRAIDLEATQLRHSLNQHETALRAAAAKAAAEKAEAEANKGADGPSEA